MEIPFALSRPEPAWTRLFLIILALGAALLFPVFCDGRLYLDDLSRSLTGLAGWGEDGRPFASAITTLLNFDYPWRSQPTLFDLSPLPQVLGLAALAAAAACLARVLFPERAGLAEALVVLPLISSPFMLQTLSYKYDALSMALAIAISVIATFDLGGLWRNIGLGAALMFLVFGLYQAAANTFIAVTALHLVVSTATGHGRGWPAVIENAAKLLVAAIAYRLIIVPLFVPPTGYSATHDVLLPLSPDGYLSAAENFRFFLGFVAELLMHTPFLSFSLAAATVIVLIRAVLHGPHGTAGSRALAIFAGTLVLILSIGGLMLLLTQPVVRPRTLMGFAVGLILVQFAVYRLTETWRPFGLVVLAVPALYGFVVAYTYAAAARDQTRFDDMLLTRIATDLETAGFTSSAALVFDGVQPRSPAGESTVSRFPTIGRLVQLNVNGDWEWGYHAMQHWGLEFTRRPGITDGEMKLLCAEPPVQTRQLYSVHVSQNTYVVSFASGVCWPKPGGT